MTSVAVRASLVRALALDLVGPGPGSEPTRPSRPRSCSASPRGSGCRSGPARGCPEIYYDPRALGRSDGRRATLHAKCIVVDRTQVFVPSANFTEAAQEGNIELGVIIRSRLLASRLADHFEGLIAAGLLKRLP
jgi:phosphatidylserine/phosphatidylglycerophosphate/cardiolipin synthase-like enzyme